MSLAQGAKALAKYCDGYGKEEFDALLRGDDELKARQARADRIREETEDLAQVLAMPHGRRVLLRILRQCGLRAKLGSHSGQVELHNMGLSLLEECVEASPAAARELLAQAFNIQ